MIWLSERDGSKGEKKTKVEKRKKENSSEIGFWEEDLFIFELRRAYTYWFLKWDMPREPYKADVTAIRVMTLWWWALLPTQAAEAAAQIWEVQLVCCSNFKRTWEVHLYADLTEILYRCTEHCRLRIHRWDWEVDGQFVSYFYLYAV